MSIKLKRNTAPATQAAANAAAEKRNKVLEEIRKRVFGEFCKCGRCRTGDYRELCISSYEIAETANALKIKTSRGKVGTWTPNSVSSLFRTHNKHEEQKQRPYTLHDFL